MLLAAVSVPVIVVFLSTVFYPDSETAQWVVSLVCQVAGAVIALLGFAGIFCLRWAAEMRREDASDLARYGHYLPE